MLRGIFILFFFLLFGEGCSLLIQGFIPGSILGMALLFIALQLKLVPEERLEPIVNFFMKNLPILFLPAAVGLMVSLPLLESHWFGILLSLTVSTTAVLLSVGWTQQWIAKKKKHPQKK